MEVAPNITVDPKIHHGVPIITGTRMPVSILVGSLAGGMSLDEVATEYCVSKEQIESVLAFSSNSTYSGEIQ
ncbi:MAG: DUF433 domain-containing protein [Acidobacteriota bacterium]|nr:DUF433 domain-containing protein [Acidobacteriota bacterium]